MAAPFSFLAARKASLPPSQTSVSPDNGAPGSAGPSVGPANPTLPERLYRPAEKLNAQLRSVVSVYLEEGKYSEGFQFLKGMLVAGTSISTFDKRYPAPLPSPIHLALAATLIVYPPLTTKAKTLDRQKGSDAAFHYLRNVYKTVDPMSDNYLVSFAFSTEAARRRLGGFRGPRPDPQVSDDSDQALKIIPATTGSLWRRAEDFWIIDGWVFNCSVAYEKRWQRWKLWLEVILGFVEAEWKERARLCEKEGADVESLLTSSLLWQYVSSQDPQNRATRRRMLRAILADGSAQAKKEFSEIWEDETKERKDLEATTAKPLDVDNGEFGDYELDDGDEERVAGFDTKISGRPTRKAALGKSTSSHGNAGSSEDDEAERSVDASMNSVDPLSGLDALFLRQRLLVLLTQVAQHLPTLFTDVEDLFDLYTEFIGPLPIKDFQAVLRTSKLPRPMQMILFTNLLLPLSSASLPNYAVLLPSQKHLEQYLLPLSATTHTYTANAKLSVILENIFMNMMDGRELKPSEKLRVAMEEGIAARDKAYVDARRKKGIAAHEEQAKGILEMSKNRLLGLLEAVEIAAGLPPRPRPHFSPPPLDHNLSSELSSAMSLSSGSDAEGEAE